LFCVTIENFVDFLLKLITFNFLKAIYIYFKNNERKFLDAEHKYSRREFAVASSSSLANLNHGLLLFIVALALYALFVNKKVYKKFF